MHRHLLLCALSLTLAIACRDSETTPRADAGANPGDDGGPGTPDSGPRDGGDVVTACSNPPIDPAPSGTCTHTPGSGSALLIRGDIVVPEGLLTNGELLIGADGRVLCAQCDCSALPERATAAVVACAKGVVSPGFINTHDHITFTETPPTPPSDPNLRYDHRHQWRRGQDGKERIASVSNTGGDNGIWWGELRQLMAGGTAVNGSGGARGLLRNLDNNRAPSDRSLQEGLEQANVHYETFPLGDSGGERLESGCGYPSVDMGTDPAIANATAYTPHISEGIDDTARNEWLCLTSGANGAVGANTALVHGIGLLAPDFAQMSALGASLIWSPRSNIDLYGHTAQVVMAAHTGVTIALGTDWTASGSMNMLRELRCADELNRRNFGSFFTDRQLVDMATSRAAAALRSEDKIGGLAAGRFADVAIFNGAVHTGYRAILDAEPEDVVLVLRGGVALYGDSALMAALPDTATGCESLDVCGVQKSVCSQRETGETIAQHRAAIRAGSYDLFFCDTPPMEPTCVPFRTGEFMGVGTDMDMDGDGVMDIMDNCPTVFNAPRPLDPGGLQANADADDLGDACDPCPLDANSSTCSRPDPNDRDRDGIANATDNCPDLANPDQANRDSDQYGDACDVCPDQSNLGGMACPGNIYQVKQGLVAEGVPLRFTNLIVTAVEPAGYYVQVARGDPAFDETLGEHYSGAYVFAGSTGMKPARGDRIDLTADTSTYFGQRQLGNGTFTVTSNNNPLPAPVVAQPADVATGGARAAQLEGVLVEVQNVMVTDLAPPPGMADTAPTNEYVVNGSLRINDQMYLTSPFPTMGQPITFIRGILRFANDHSKLEPRDLADVGVPEALAGFEPNPALVPLGNNGVPPGGLRVRINRPASTALTIMLSSSDPSVIVPATVMVAAGADGADIPVQAPSEVAGPVTLTATYDGRMVQGGLRVYSDNTPRLVVSLALERTIVGVGTVVGGVVTLDLPGRTGGTSVALGVTPPGLASAPAAVTVAPAGREATFSLTASTTPGSASLSASAGANTATVAFTVTNSIRRPPMAGDLLITEIFRNPSTSNEHFHEWFEIFNTTGDVIELDGIEVADNSAMHVLATGGAALDPGTYAVIAYSGDSGTNGGVTAIAEYEPGDLRLANGDDLITLRYQGMVIDVVDWGSGWPGGGQGVSMCLRFPYAAGNNVAAAWSNSAGTFGGGTERGSPGQASNATNCP